MGCDEELFHWLSHFVESIAMPNRGAKPASEWPHSTSKPPKWLTDAVKAQGRNGERVKSASKNHMLHFCNVAVPEIEARLGEPLPNSKIKSLPVQAVELVDNESELSAHDQRVLFFELAIEIANYFDPYGADSSSPSARGDRKKFEQLQNEIAEAATNLASLVSQYAEVSFRLRLDNEIEFDPALLLWAAARKCNNASPINNGEAGHVEGEYRPMTTGELGQPRYFQATLPSFFIEVANRFQNPLLDIVLPESIEATEPRTRGIGDFVIALDESVGTHSLDHDGFLPARFFLPNEAMAALAALLLDRPVEPPTVAMARRRKRHKFNEKRRIDELRQGLSLGRLPPFRNAPKRMR